MTQMRWTQLLSPIRLGSKKSLHEQGRGPFHKDYDRIIFSQSFRQLNRKTQVHPLTQNDGIHTRLTHSLEVSCIGRSLGMLAAEKIRDHLPAWIDPADIGAIIQAACLAHDIGNPPFGHAGEYAIRDWFITPKHHKLLDDLSAEQKADVLQFEGNAQGLRVLTRLEYHPNDGGMRLTYATLGAYLKYPWLVQPVADQSRPSHKRGKFGCYQSEKEILFEIAEQLGLIQVGPTRFCRHPLAYLLEAADDICYALIDLEDGLQLGMLAYSEVEPLFLDLIADYGAPEEIYMNVPVPQKIAALRGRAMKRLVDEVTDAFKRHHDEILAGELKGSLLDHCPADLCKGVEAAKNMTRQRIFTHPQKARLELVANASLHTLLDALMPLAVHPQQSLNFKQQRLIHVLTAHGACLVDDQPYENIMQILDMVSSLSDHQAYALAQELQGNRMGLM